MLIYILIKLFVAHYSKMVKPQTYGHLDWMHCWHQVIVPGGLANLDRCSQSPSFVTIIMCPQYQSRESRVHKKDKEQDTVDHRQEGKKLAKYRQHLKKVAMKMMMIVRIILIRAVLMRMMLMKNFRK